MQSVVWNEAVKINGADADYHRRDLWNAIHKGDYPIWDLGMQLFDEETANKLDFDVLDPTKLIPEEIVPVQKVGHMVLDKTVDNFFAETEQVAFCTSNMVPGIDTTNDPLLQIRNFSYLDTQLKRLGSTNFTKLPINAPRCPVMNFQQDGHMAMTNPHGRANYEPNSWGGPRENPNKGYVSDPSNEQGQKLRLRPESFADHYSQARQFYISQTAVEQGHIKDALIFELSNVKTPEIRERVVSHLINIDQNLAQSVAQGLGMKTMPTAAKAAKPTRMDLPQSPALSILKNAGDFKGRKLGILVSEGANSTVVKALKDAAVAVGADVEIVAPTVGGVTAADGSHIDADRKYEGGPSVLFDAIAVVTSKNGAAQLANRPAAKDFVSDAFAHCKFIAYNEDSLALLDKAGVAADNGVIKVDSSGEAKSFIQACNKLRLWQREEKLKMAAK